MLKVHINVVPSDAYIHKVQNKVPSYFMENIIKEGLELDFLTCAVKVTKDHDCYCLLDLTGFKMVAKTVPETNMVSSNVLPRVFQLN